MAEHLMVFTTTDSREDAEQLATSAVGARLAACAQIDGPLMSVYWWEGSVQTDQEWRVAFKTPAAKYDALEAHIRNVHAYETPEIIATDITRGSAAYLQWLEQETSS
ncbi:divalent-cation tolerance protein CutA [Streptomyces sp. URMC 129]|uniref:divalent-cation tolerance protein CutA n=1 Tax=Streptomyces sp. URMC 129 TaxID=3423407 RepID=UPI003F1C7EA2